MRKSNQQSLGQLLSQFIKENRLESGLTEAELQNCWKEIAGEFMARHTTELKIYKNILTVRMDNAACREELLYRRSELLERVKNFLGNNAITDISIR